MGWGIGLESKMGSSYIQAFFSKGGPKFLKIYKRGVVKMGGTRGNRVP